MACEMARDWARRVMDVRIETLPAVQVLCCRRVGPYQDTAQEAWQSLWGWVRAHGVVDRVQGAYGYGLDDPRTTAPGKQRYDACLAIAGDVAPEDAAGIVARTLPGGCYAIHRHKGPYHQMGAVFGHLRDQWLPTSGQTLEANRPFLEIYLNDPSEVPESDYLTDLCLPIRA